MDEINGENQPPEIAENRRCPTCDTLNTAGATICIMCGNPLPVTTSLTEQEEREIPAPPEPAGSDTGEPLSPADITSEEISPALLVGETTAETPPSAAVTFRPGSQVEVIESVMREHQSSTVTWITIIIFIITVIIGYLILQFAEPVTSLALFPTFTPIPPTATLTPTPTLVPTDTPEPTPEPSETPIPTATPPPPRTSLPSGCGRGDTVRSFSVLRCVVGSPYQPKRNHHGFAIVCGPGIGSALADGDPATGGYRNGN